MYLPYQTEKKNQTIECDGYILQYRLMETEGKGRFKHIYSVTVSIRREDYYAEKSAFDISRIRKRAEGIFEMLWKNQVTPATLLEVLEEIL